ncbi:MAG: flagellar hook basal-body protein [Ignavibacteriaceae bacterium]|nr:flagellar hook basal-body protein [Ignavibacteriaceae bacterium]
MVKGIYTAARALDSRMRNLDIVANNLANVNTTGYKREIPFSEVIDEYGNAQIRQTSDFRPGDLAQTSNPLDLAIVGNGFFVVQSENGLQMTRNGKLSISSEGYLVNEQGYKLMGKNGAININNLQLDKEKQLTISNTGEIKFGDQSIDSILIVKPEDPQESERISGENFSAGTSGYTVSAEGEYQIRQGYIEESNVNPIKEMQDMIMLNSQYDSAHKMINYLDKTLDEANQIGKV